MLSDPELGTIEFGHNERSKHIRVRILSNGLKVTMPLRSTEADAMKFINSIRGKILQKQEKIEKGLETRNILIDENSKLQTLTFAVESNLPIEKIFISL